MPKRYIVNPQNEKGIIAEIISDSMIKILKRRSDHNPISVIIKGPNWDVLTNCTLTGDAVFIECIDGKIKEESLTIIEKENEDGKDDTTEQSNTGPSGPTGADRPTNRYTRNESNTGPTGS